MNVWGFEELASIKDGQKLPHPDWLNLENCDHIIVAHSTPLHHLRLLPTSHEHCRMANDPPPPARGGLSLYANLLGSKSSTPGSITGAPVSYKQSDAAEEDEAAKKQQSLAGT